MTSVTTGQPHTNPKTGKNYYYKDNKRTHDLNNKGRMWVSGKYISKTHVLHKAGRFRNWEDAYSHNELDTVEGGYVYVLTNKAWPAWVKIGMAMDASDRCRGYQTACPFRDFKVAGTILTDNRREAEMLAHELASALAEERRNEWFKMPVDEALQVINEIQNNKELAA
jgi:hypothetical protein